MNDNEQTINVIKQEKEFKGFLENALEQTNKVISYPTELYSLPTHPLEHRTNWFCILHKVCDTHRTQHTNKKRTKERRGGKKDINNDE